MIKVMVPSVRQYGDFGVGRGYTGHNRGSEQSHPTDGDGYGFRTNDDSGGNGLGHGYDYGFGDGYGYKPVLFRSEP